MPEVDDDFVASFGVSEGGVAAFRENVRENMARELKQAVSRLLRSEVLNKLVANFDKLEVPASMLSAETLNMQEQAQQQAQQLGLTDPELPPAENFSEKAEHRVRAALLVGEVARHAKLQVDAGRVRDMVNEIASTYETPQSIVNLYYSDEKLLANVQNVVLEEQAVEWVLERAKVKPRSMGFDEVMKPETEA
jgi:trigger factor